MSHNEARTSWHEAFVEHEQVGSFLKDSITRFHPPFFGLK